MSLPAGTVTFLFTDIEGSTRLLDELGPEAYAEALSTHRRALRGAFAAHGGVEVERQGDSFFFAFARAGDAVAAALASQAALGGGPISVRMGLHTGAPIIAAEGYVGMDVHRAARIAAVAHGGQVLLSDATRQRVDGIHVRDLGLHRLKDLDEALRLFQLGDREFPPLKSLYRANLPVQATPLIGRDDALDGLCELIERRDVRLVTLTGPGGIGKTRLALAGAERVARGFPDGVHWIALQALHDAELVLPTIAQALESQDVAAAVGNGAVLLVLDNFEQVVDAATVVSDLLTACPNLAILVTSREPLHVRAEHEWPVPPLAEDAAVELFAERAQAARPDFIPGQEADAICRRLDGLPLAIELAAAHVRSLSPGAMLERFERRLDLLAAGPRDLPERHRTLRATIDWSYELLTPAEQGCSLVSPCSRVAAHRWRPRRSATPTSTRSNLSSRRVCCGSPTGASGCSRRSGSSHASGCRSRTRPKQCGDVMRTSSSLSPRRRRRVGEARTSRRGSIISTPSSTTFAPRSLGWRRSATPSRVALVVEWRASGTRVGAGSRGAAGGPGARPDSRRADGSSGEGPAGGSMFAEPLGITALEGVRRRVLAILREFEDPAELGRGLSALGVSTIMLGGVEQARALFEEAALHLVALRQRFNLALVLANRANLLLDRIRHARSRCSRRRSRSPGIGTEHRLPHCLYTLAFLRFRAGREREAEAGAREAVVVSPGPATSGTRCSASFSSARSRRVEGISGYPRACSAPPRRRVHASASRWTPLPAKSSRLHERPRRDASGARACGVSGGV